MKSNQGICNYNKAFSVSGPPGRSRHALERLGRTNLCLYFVFGDLPLHLRTHARGPALPVRELLHSDERPRLTEVVASPSSFLYMGSSVERIAPTTKREAARPVVKKELDIIRVISVREHVQHTTRDLGRSASTTITPA